MSVNKVILIGNAGRDAEVSYPEKGQTLCRVSLATTERAHVNSQGTQIPERTEWHRLVMWGSNAKVAERYIKKGTHLYVEGKLRTRVWEDKHAIKRSVTEIYVDSFELL